MNPYHEPQFSVASWEFSEKSVFGAESGSLAVCFD
jgi:hypothetical protein